MSTEKKTFPEALKEAREKAGITQAEMSKRMGYSSPQFVSNWERGVCTLPIGKAPLFCQITGMKMETMKSLLATEALSKINHKMSLKSKKRTAKV